MTNMRAPQVSRRTRKQSELAASRGALKAAAVARAKSLARFAVDQPPPPPPPPSSSAVSPVRLSHGVDAAQANGTDGGARSPVRRRNAAAVNTD